jgi:methionyl-tRNA formyltransferase
MRRVYISNNVPTGERCKTWAAKNLPDGFEVTDHIEDCDIFISICYDQILSEEFINSHECFNFHPARLPQYAGVGGCTWSILNGDAQHWVTIHEIDKGIDTGDIIYESSLEVSRADTAQSLHAKVMHHLFAIFKVIFSSLLLDTYGSYKQDESKRKLWMYKDLKDALDLTAYMRATHFPGKKKPFYINIHGDRIELDYV